MFQLFLIRCILTYAHMAISFWVHIFELHNYITKLITAHTFLHTYINTVTKYAHICPSCRKFTYSINIISAFRLLWSRKCMLCIHGCFHVFPSHQRNTRAWKFDLQTKLLTFLILQAYPNFAYICSSFFIPSFPFVSNALTYMSFLHFLFINATFILKNSCPLWMTYIDSNNQVAAYTNKYRINSLYECYGPWYYIWNSASKLNCSILSFDI